MSFTIEAILPPIRWDNQDTAWVGQSRIPLEIVITAFLQGESPEQIAVSYDTLALSDIYGVIAYYLQHQETIDAYLAQQQQQADQLRQDLERQQPQLFTTQTRLRALKMKR